MAYLTYDQRVANMHRPGDEDKQLMLAKGTVTRLRNKLRRATNISLEEKVARQKEIDEASAVLRKLRLNIFDLEDELERNHFRYWRSVMNEQFYIERIAPSNDRVTRGRLYLYTNGRITDDKGAPMSPSIHDKYWKVRHDIAVPPPVPPPYTAAVSQPIKSNLKETTMLNIKSTTLIDGIDADHFSVENLIEFIKGEECKIEKLSVINSKSKAIAKLKAKHEVNIAKLVEILDAKEDV